MQHLQSFMDARYEDVLTAIRTTGALAQETEDRLKEALAELLKDYRKEN